MLIQQDSIEQKMEDVMHIIARYVIIIQLLEDVLPVVLYLGNAFFDVVQCPATNSEAVQLDLLPE